MYTDGDIYFGTELDPNMFDELEEPPPVHIIYPRPPHNHCRQCTVVAESTILSLIMLLCVSELMGR